MNIIERLTEALGAAAIGVFVLVILLLIVLIAKSLWHVCGPNEILIFSGRRTKWPDGSIRGFRVEQGGGFRNPIFEKVERMSLNVMEVPISIRSAYSRGGIALNVDAIANVKISSDSAVIGNAIERFLNTDPNNIRRVAKETLEGHLRGVLARLTPEEVNEDRLKFAEELSIESEHDLRKLGIHLDTLKIQHVSDDRRYLDSIGRGAIANIIKDAEIAESDAEREAELAEAENQTRASVAQATADANIAKMKNELRTVMAELDSMVKSEEERTSAAAREARAIAEQQLQKLRVELEGLRLKIDQVLPAEAARTAQEFRARGEAAILRERGLANSQAVELLSSAWKDAGDAAVTLFVLEDLEKLLAAASKGVGKIKVNDLQVIDNGDGTVIANYLSSYPEMLRRVLDAVTQTTGMDISRAISGAPRAEAEVKA